MGAIKGMVEGDTIYIIVESELYLESRLKEESSDTDCGWDIRQLCAYNRTKGSAIITNLLNI
jgi:hypothetical protein